MSFISTVTAISVSIIILPPPLKKPVFRLCISVLYLQGVLIFMLFQQLIIFLMLVFHLFIQIFWRFRFIKVTVIKLLKFIGTVYKILYRILGRVLSIQVEVINCIICRAYAAGAAQRSVGHLTTYGPTDNPTFTTPYFPLWQTREHTNESRTRTTYCNCSTPQVIPTGLNYILFN